MTSRKIDRYRDDPVAFVHDCFKFRPGERVTPYQEEILSELPAKKRVAMRGPRGLGKTALSAWEVIWFSLTREGMDWKAPTTAGNWRQLSEFLWPEIVKWCNRLRWDQVGREPFRRDRELLTMAIRLEGGSAFAMTSKQGDLVEGAHARRMFYLFDESKSIPDEIWDSSEGAFSGEEGFTMEEGLWMAVSTPGPPMGRFYDIHSRRPGYEDWWVRHVTIDECISCGMISEAWVERKRKQWGENDPRFKNQVLGEFASFENVGIIPIEWVEAAMKRWKVFNKALKENHAQIPPLTGYGLDIGYVKDPSILFPRYGWYFGMPTRIENADKDLVVATATGKLLNLVDAAKKAGRRPPYIVIDSVGEGSGAYTDLKKGPIPTVAFRAGEGTDKRDNTGELGFRCKRDWMWWEMREGLDPYNPIELALPPMDDLKAELITPSWEIRGADTVVVEQKKKVRSRLGRSTDYADSFGMIYVTPGPSRSGWKAVKVNTRGKKHFTRS